MTTLTDWLDQAEERADPAWRVADIWASDADPDAAAARTDLPAAIAALRAVLDLVERDAYYAQVSADGEALIVEADDVRDAIADALGVQP